jgi:hypothetical protein
MAVSLLSACGNWKTEPLAPSQVVSEKEPSQVRLTMLDGGEIKLADPIVSVGEIVGHPVRGRNAVKSDTLRVPIDSVMYASTPSSEGTVAVLFLVAFVASTAYEVWHDAGEGACCQ